MNLNKIVQDLSFILIFLTQLSSPSFLFVEAFLVLASCELPFVWLGWNLVPV